MSVTAIIRFKNSALYEARKRLGLSQAEMADKVGCTISVLQGWESFLDYPLGPNAWQGEKNNGRNKKNREKEILSLECLTGMTYDELFPEEYRNSVDKKLGRTVEVVGEMAALPEWAGEERMLESPEDIYIRNEEKEGLKEEMVDALKTLTEREAKVLKMRFGLDGYDKHTLEEISQKPGWPTRERIRQIEAKALRKLKHPRRGGRLKRFINTGTKVSPPEEKFKDACNERWPMLWLMCESSWGGKFRVRGYENTDHRDYYEAYWGEGSTAAKAWEDAYYNLTEKEKELKCKSAE